jgi:hypothetical protein
MSLQCKSSEQCCNSALADKTYPRRQICVAIINRNANFTDPRFSGILCMYVHTLRFLKHTWRPVGARGKKVGTATDMLFVLLVSFRDREPPILREVLDAHYLFIADSRQLIIKLFLWHWSVLC